MADPTQPRPELTVSSSCCGPDEPCCGPPRTASASPSRREFLQAAALSAVAAASLKPSARTMAMAGPFEDDEFRRLVPADKKLTAEWVASLTARGEPTVSRGEDLARIGMPIGGLCAGQLYLGGDGTLWHWDIFNRVEQTGTTGAHYANPMKPTSPLEQGFAIRTKAADGAVSVRSLDREGFPGVTFRGEYPIGTVRYEDPTAPVSVMLEAYSPFIPLETDDSSLPATVMTFTIKNNGPASVDVELAGWLENAVGLDAFQRREGQRVGTVERDAKRLAVAFRAKEPPAPAVPVAERADVTVSDFESPDYGGWTATGTAFGKGPVRQAEVPSYQGPLGIHGERAVNTHSAPIDATEVGGRDAAVGTLTSPPFRIERHFLRFLIGGGSHVGKTCANLLIDDRVVLTATGANANRMKSHIWNVRPWEGREARVQLIDNERGPWGNIGFDDLVQTDRPTAALPALVDEPDFGTMGLALLGPRPGDRATAALPEGVAPLDWLKADDRNVTDEAALSVGAPMIGALSRSWSIKPGETATATFVLAWHFPNLSLPQTRLPAKLGRYYASRFDSASAVSRYIATEFERLDRDTRLWRETWYDSTLPIWFLDRTFLNTSILATSTAHRFRDGRFWGWEGVGCCAGTCAHVWHYAQAVGRLFPELERILRERVDYVDGVGFEPKTGAIRFRSEDNDFPAMDAQAGAILRTYREHQMSADDAFLARVWPRTKQALEFLIRADGNNDGILEGPQHNTLDAEWYGQVPWLSSLYLAALRAGAAMGRERGEPDYADRLDTIADRGAETLVARLWKPEFGYFIQRPDPAHASAVGTYDGCHIDQVFGQHWAFQVGLGRVLDETKVKAALRALWTYNFTPDVGPYREVHKPGRWYAMPGEAGLLMATFPKSPEPAIRDERGGWSAMYFNECMNGFEYQVAGHMLWEGMITEGLAITRALHDRYDASRRNPWNEIECGDHYARSMASFGVYLAAIGFDCHGPKGHLGFDPRVAAEDCRAAFTVAEGWGTFSQKRENGGQSNAIAVRKGSLRLNSLAFGLPEGLEPKQVTATVGGRAIALKHRREGRTLRLDLADELRLGAGERLDVMIS